MTELCELSAVELRRMIGAKQISPVELLDACIARIERLNPAVNAVTATDFDRAREEAKTAEQAVMNGEPLGPLHGLPVGVKDLQDTKGLRTTYGSPLHADHVPTADEAQVARVRASGAILFCKTNVPEWGAGANTRNPVWGATGNPFDPDLICGGSSGGSAVALALDMMPLATGSDTGGSLRIPAAFCGVVGHRPSPGLVPTNKRAFGWSPISVLGPMGRDVADTALLLSAQASTDTVDPLAGPTLPIDLEQPQRVDLSDLRIAVSKDLGFAPVSNGIAQVFQEKIAVMESMFARCEWHDPQLKDADGIFEVIRAVQYLGRYQAAYEKDPDSLGPNTRANYEQGMKMSLADFAWAHTAQTQAYRDMQTLFDEFDLILCPTTPVTPFPWTQLTLDQIDDRKLRTYFHWLALTYGITITGHPACSIPCGTDQNGMPFGLQVVGPRHGDTFLLAACAALEAAFAGNAKLTRPRPDLSRLAEPRPALREAARR